MMRMTPWLHGLFVKAHFLMGWEGVFTSSEYDRMEEDERDFYLVYLSEEKKNREQPKKD